MQSAENDPPVCSSLQNAINKCQVPETNPSGIRVNDPPKQGCVFPPGDPLAEQIREMAVDGMLSTAAG